MRIVFLGTPEIAATILQMLMGEHDIVAAFTRPDAIRSRGSKQLPTPVKALCEDAGIPVFTPKNVKDPAVEQQIRDLDPEVICVVAFGAIIPDAILDIPPYGCLNVHTSLLPRWRGAAPVERAILNGDETTGVTIMKVRTELDTGPIAAMESMPTGHLNITDLRSQLAIRGGKLLLQVLELLPQGKVDWQEQGGENLVYAEKLKKHELYVDETDDAVIIERKVRTSSISHPCKLTLANKKVTLEEVALVAADDDILEAVGSLQPGEVLFTRKRLLLATTDGFIEVLSIRPDGKQSMDAKAFCAGIPGAKNTVLQWGSYE